MEASFPQQCLFLLRRLWLLREVPPPLAFSSNFALGAGEDREREEALVTQWSGISSSLVGGRRERRRRRTDEWGNPAEGGRESG